MTDFLTPFLPSYFQPWHIPAVFLAGLIGEGYSVVIGSGGVLIQFVLSSLGMPLASVIATDLAGCLGACAGIIVASPSQKKTWKKRGLLLALGIPLLAGGIVGTMCLIYISATVLKYILIAGLSLLLLQMFSGKKPVLKALEDLHFDLKKYPVLFVVLFALGVYGNVSGVGSGTFMKIALVGLLHMSVADGIFVDGIINVPPTLFSFGATAMKGLIVWPYCLTLWLGTFIGARYTTKIATRIPNRYLQGLLIVVVTLYLGWLLVSL